MDLSDIGPAAQIPNIGLGVVVSSYSAEAAHAAMHQLGRDSVSVVCPDFRTDSDNRSNMLKCRPW